jgi:hypothetical protein
MLRFSDDYQHPQRWRKRNIPDPLDCGERNKLVRVRAFNAVRLGSKPFGYGVNQESILVRWFVVLVMFYRSFETLMK